MIHFGFGIVDGGGNRATDLTFPTWDEAHKYVCRSNTMFFKGHYKVVELVYKLRQEDKCHG